MDIISCLSGTLGKLVFTVPTHYGTSCNTLCSMPKDLYQVQ